jgi:hypothetical protein
MRLSRYLGIWICSIVFHLGQVALFWAEPAQAITFRITNRSGGAGDAVADAFENFVNNSLFPPGNDERFLQAEGAASIGSTRSLIGDTLSKPEIFVVGFQAGAALGYPNNSSGASAKPQRNSLPGLGLGAQTSILVGIPAEKFIPLPFWGLDPRKMVFYINGFSLSEKIGTDVDLSLTTIGVGATYDLNSGSRVGAAISWDGWQMSSGLQYSRTKLSYLTPMDLNFSSGGGSIAWAGNLDLGVVSNIVSIPTDIRTGFTLFKFLQPYVGLGIDLNFGASTLTGVTSGPITSGGTIAGYTGTGTLDANTQSPVAPSFISGRGFLGLQLHLWALKLMGQVTGATMGSAKTVSFVLGLKLAL